MLPTYATRLLVGLFMITALLSGVAVAETPAAGPTASSGAAGDLVTAETDGLLFSAEYEAPGSCPYTPISPFYTGGC